ncbi:MAG: MmcQ/YjbR family DNA-binding protein [Clostridia bacterium]|nr:MmcQ/YjbR family DNA-binding protein [Clostridia bacterium]
MLTLDDIYNYCSAKKYACASQPFGFDSLLFKIANHYFCILYELKGRSAITVKCTAEQGIFLREKYNGDIVRGYHCPPVQQPYNNTIYLDSKVPDSEIYEMIDFSYSLVLSKLTKRERALHLIDVR